MNIMPIIPAAAIASAHVAANMIRNNMQRGSSYCEGLSYKDRHLIAVQNALLQCQDLSNIPTVKEYIFTNTDAKERTKENCINCKHSKYFAYLIYNEDEECYESKYICMKKLIELSLNDSIIDNEHICNLYEYDESKNNKCCCCGE
jgi:hypothetical protein